MRTRTLLYSIAAIVACASCSKNCTEQELTGLWIAPVPGMPGRVQGIVLERDGTARTIGTATLAYESWACSGDELLLTGESRGNGANIRFTDTLRIESVSADSLILMRGKLRIGYSRSIEERGIPAAPGRIVRGTVTFAPEARTFRPDGDTALFWLIDRSGYLNERYRESGAAQWSAEAELELMPADPAAAEFAARYRAAYEVTRIIRLSEPERN